MLLNVVFVSLASNTPEILTSSHHYCYTDQMVKIETKIQTVTKLQLFRSLIHHQSCLVNYISNIYLLAPKLNPGPLFWWGLFFLLVVAGSFLGEWDRHVWLCSGDHTQCPKSNPGQLPVKQAT